MKPASKRLGPIGLSLVAALLLSACASDTVEENPLVCPETAILAQGAKLVRFQPGPGRDIIDVVHQETIEGFDGACEWDENDDGAGTLRVEISPRIRSDRGPANTDGLARFEYFVALTNASGKVINKQRFPVSLSYPGSVGQIMWQDEIPVSMALPLKAGETAGKWRIFISLQLTREDLEFIRQIR